VLDVNTTIKHGALYQVCRWVSRRVPSHIFVVPTSSRTLVDRAVDRAHRLLGPSQMDYEIYQFDIAKWFPHLKVIQRLIRSDNALE